MKSTSRVIEKLEKLIEIEKDHMKSIKSQIVNTRKYNCEFNIKTRSSNGNVYWICENCEIYRLKPCTPESQGCVSNKYIITKCNECGATNFEEAKGKKCNFCEDGIYIHELKE